MSAKNPVGDNEKATTVVADDCEETLKSADRNPAARLQNNRTGRPGGPPIALCSNAARPSSGTHQASEFATVVPSHGRGRRFNPCSAHCFPRHSPAAIGTNRKRSARFGTTTMQGKLAMHLSRRCGARTRSRTPCRSPAMLNGRCRMHGGPPPGAPKGNKHALKHGRYSAEAIARRLEIRELLRAVKALASTAREQT